MKGLGGENDPQIIMYHIVGDPERTKEKRNGGITELREITQNLKRWNDGTTEHRKIAPNS